MATWILSNSHFLRKKKSDPSRGNNENTRPLSGFLIPLECSTEPKKADRCGFRVRTEVWLEGEIWESSVEIFEVLVDSPHQPTLKYTQNSPLSLPPGSSHHFLYLDE